MAHMDIFNNDAFSLVQMTQAIQKLPTVPSFLGGLGIFDEEGVDTNIVSIEQVGQTLQIIPTSLRGTAPPMATTDKRQLRNFNIPRVAKGDQIFASEIQGIRAFGTESELETIVQKVAQKQAKLLREVAMTLELHRLGAIQGILPDGAGRTLYNFFTEFGIAQPGEIDFDLDNANPVEGALKNKIQAARRAVLRALGASAVPGQIQFIWLCGDTFYDQFTSHPEVRETYKNWEAASALRGSVGRAFDTFTFGEMDWVNYRGSDDNTTVAIAAGECKLVIRGVPGLYRRFNGPGETMETVNTIGQPLYSMLVRDMQRNMWVQPEVYAYPLHMITRPEIALRGRNT